MIRNDFNQYIDKYIEGYLLADLKTIHEKVDHDGKYEESLGNLAYLFTIALCSAMEFLGLLLRDDSPVKTDDNGKTMVDASGALGSYLKKYMKPIDSKYSVFSTVAPQLIRNGIAHSYATKGNIGITRQGGREDSHFVKYGTTGVILINPDYIYEDFIKSYETLKKDMSLDSNLTTKMESNYNAIKAIYSAEVSTFMGQVNTSKLEWKYKSIDLEGDGLIDHLEIEGGLIFVS